MEGSYALPAQSMMFDRNPVDGAYVVSGESNVKGYLNFIPTVRHQASIFICSDRKVTASYVKRGRIVMSRSV